jgi:hypothetical protein
MSLLRTERLLNLLLQWDRFDAWYQLARLAKEHKEARETVVEMRRFVLEMGAPPVMAENAQKAVDLVLPELQRMVDSLNEVYRIIIEDHPSLLPLCGPEWRLDDPIDEKERSEGMLKVRSAVLALTKERSEATHAGKQQRADPSEANKGPHQGIQAIRSLGDLRYQVGQEVPLRVTEDEDTVLQTFLEKPTRLFTRDLKAASGLEDPVSILRRLTTKYSGAFACCIVRPGRKASEGYFVKVVNGTDPK